MAEGPFSGISYSIVYTKRPKALSVVFQRTTVFGLWLSPTDIHSVLFIKRPMSIGPFNGMSKNYHFFCGLSPILYYNILLLLSINI